MQGAPPLASPRLSRRQHGITLRNRYPAGACPAGCRLTVPLWCPQGGACLPCRLLAPAFSLLSFPHPPARARRALFPSGEGGDFRLFYARGSAPCIPAPEPEATRDNPAEQIPGGGLSGWLPADRVTVVPARGACLLCRLPTLPLACFTAPIPPTPFPSGEGGD